MKPLLYKGCLDLISQRDGLEVSELVPMMLSDIMIFEEELKAEFPKEYEEFLVRVGGGLELGGLAEWFHLDLSVENNLIDANRKLFQQEDYNPPKNFLAVYDAKDGSFFGFQKKGSAFQSTVMMWDSEDKIFEPYAENLYEFLEQNVDCSEEEIEAIQTNLQDILLNPPTNGHGEQAVLLQNVAKKSNADDEEKVTHLEEEFDLSELSKVEFFEEAQKPA